MNAYGVYGSPQELGFRQWHFSDYEALARTFPAADCLRILAAVNLSLENGGVADAGFQEWLAGLFLPSASVRKMKHHFARSNRPFIWVSPVHFRLLISF